MESPACFCTTLPSWFTVCMACPQHERISLIKGIDLFNTNREDIKKSDTSSYLDLAPLYGSTQQQQDAVRLKKDGLLKPDTFHEARLLGQPPGVNVLLVLYSRFHNHVATMLAEINEDGRFTLPKTPSDEAVVKRDNDIFQTARL